MVDWMDGPTPADDAKERLAHYWCARMLERCAQMRDGCVRQSRCSHIRCSCRNGCIVHLWLGGGRWPVIVNSDLAFRTGARLRTRKSYVVLVVLVIMVMVMVVVVGQRSPDEEVRVRQGVLMRLRHESGGDGGSAHCWEQ